MKERDDLLEEIREERMRQLDIHGYSSTHDSRVNDDAELARAAAAYCLSASGHTIAPGFCWPAHWDVALFKPKFPRRDLIKAGALILAELERIERS